MSPRRVAAAAVLALGAALVPATPASAHALLLRTEPSPQTTVKTAPSAVRLFFSEPVEVAFGAIRVFDVDGRRVDPGKLRRVGDGSQVDVPLSGIGNGTYTVTWRAVSADGHPVHGGFSFYVGSPSSISAVAVAGEQGTGRLVGWGFGVVRFGWFSAFLLLVGAVAVRRWVWTPAVAAAGLGQTAAADAFRRRFGPALLATWAVLAVTGVLSLVFQAATASGLSLVSAARPDVLRQVLHTTYGRLWLLTAGLTAVLLVPVVALGRRTPLWGIVPKTWLRVLALVSAALAVVAAMNSHARTVPAAVVGEASVAVHLLSVAMWVGGLVALVALGGLAWRALPAGDRPALLRQVVPRFSRLAVAAVAAVVVSGVVNSVLELGAPGDLWRLSYGRAILAKVALLALALGLAARHRWVVPARLSAGAAGPPGGAEATVASFERSSRLEAAFLAGAVAVTAALVVMVPGRTVALAAAGPVNQTGRAGGYTVQLYIDPTTVGANEVHVSFVTPAGLAAAEVANADVSLTSPGQPPTPLALRLISPGHFVADADLPGPGRYLLAVSGNTGSAAPSTSFTFKLSDKNKGDRP